ncbi:MAG: HDIG domain-containing protein [Peptococcaceae bacterium]|jgi:putative nucleotidyltransferase with HDIG domain|nr:HDIG domain-containing protein [Peptococcaceae bacterium]
MFSLKKYVLGAWRVVPFLARQNAVRRGLVGLLFLALITAVVSMAFLPRQYDLKVNQVAPATIQAPRTVQYENTADTRAARQAAMGQVPRQYDFNPQVESQVTGDIDKALSAVQAAQNSAAGTSARETQLQAALPFSVPSYLLSELVRPNASELNRLHRGLDGLVRQAMEAPGGVANDKLTAARASLAAGISSLYLDSAYQALAGLLITNYLKPNEIYDPARTQAAQEAAARAVAPVMATVKRGQKIVGEGEIVTSGEVAALQALGLSRPGSADAGLAGTALLVALLMAVILFYLYQQNRALFRNSSHLYLLGIVMILVLAVGKAILSINMNQGPFGVLVGYAVPVAAAGMLVTVLLDSRTAVVVTAVLAVLVAVMADYQLRFGIVGFIGGITGVFAVSRLSQRGDLVRAGIFVAGSSALAILTVGLSASVPWAVLAPASLILGAVNGVLSSVLTNGALPFLEGTFGITSPVRLLELANPNHVLLRRLLTEAPGTYHHSIIMGNMAEAAASAVGGDGPLVRAGAYFHDIGKVKRPYFFIENQINGENPHDKISPSLSTLILTSHVRDGVEMAREHKVPRSVVDIIEQHHGTGLITYFYHKALENDRTETLTEEEFRYEGPRPKTREAAIVMLADIVEAAVRALANPTPGRVEGLVRKLIKDKFLDGQLDECDLTFKDLDSIAGAFLQVLSGIFHYRIEYPDLTRQLTERRVGNAGARKQSARRSAG